MHEKIKAMGEGVLGYARKFCGAREGLYCVLLRKVSATYRCSHGDLGKVKK